MVEGWKRLIQAWKDMGRTLEGQGRAYGPDSISEVGVLGLSYGTEISA